VTAPVAALGERLPGAHLALAVASAAMRSLQEEWLASPIARWALAGPRPAGFAIRPKDYRPGDAEAGRRILAGAFVLAGATQAVGVRGDPWDRPSPSRAFAAALHGFEWLPDLIAAGEAGEAEALRLVLEWRRLFGRWNEFAWSPPVLERRVFNLACAAKAIAARASDAESSLLARDLSRQARALLAAGRSPPRAAERAAAAGVAGAALSGRAGALLLRRALPRLATALDRSVSAEGGHASRSPQAALELLLDLRTLEDALTQRGLVAPEAMLRAVERLAAAVRFFTLADGGLAAFHGGRACAPAYVSAARADDEAEGRPAPPGLGGYQRAESRNLQLVVDAAPPPPAPWSSGACAQPLGLEILAGGRRLIGGGVDRLIEGGSTIRVGERRFGRVLSGFAAEALGPWLLGADGEVEVQRHEQAGGIWLDLSHHGWLARYGILHQRRLFLDLAADELRGEDRLTPTARAQGPDGRHFIPYVLRFHLAPDVSALVSQDRRSVVLRAHGAAAGWQFRNDSLDVAVEPSLHPSGRPSQQMVLRGRRRADSGARVRWKLAPAVQRVDGPGPAA
jgi:uncharacterized heparinase superfamily protein